MNNFLAILELRAFYIEYKKVKFTAINFRCRTNVKYFMQIQLLRFCKDIAKVSSLRLLKLTTKSTHFLPAKKKILILWIELKGSATSFSPLTSTDVGIYPKTF